MLHRHESLLEQIHANITFTLKLNEKSIGFFLNKFIYLFIIFGYVGSLFMHEGFL